MTRLKESKNERTILPILTPSCIIYEDGSTLEDLLNKKINTTFFIPQEQTINFVANNSYIETSFGKALLTTTSPRWAYPQIRFYIRDVALMGHIVNYGDTTPIPNSTIEFATINSDTAVAEGRFHVNATYPLLENEELTIQEALIKLLIENSNFPKHDNYIISAD